MNDRKMKGFMFNSKAKVEWELSLDAPIDEQERLIRLNRIHKIDLTKYTYGMSNVEQNFADLHNKAYEEILKGNGTKPKALARLTRLISEMTEKAVKLRGY